MKNEMDIDLTEQMAESVYYYNDEDRFYRDAVLQIKHKKPRVYIYNKKIMERIQKEFPDLQIVKRDFYWEVINNVTKTYIRKKGRPTKEQNNNS